MNDYTVEWHGTYRVSIEGKMCFGIRVSRTIEGTIDDAITVAKLALEALEHHGLNSLDIVDCNTGEVHCTVKRGE